MLNGVKCDELMEICSVKLLGKQDCESISEFYSRIQDVIDSLYEIAISQEEMGEKFEFTENGVTDKRNLLLESAIEETEEVTRCSTINEQVHTIKNTEKTTRHQQDNLKLEKDD